MFFAHKRVLGYVLAVFGGSLGAFVCGWRMSVESMGNPIVDKVIEVIILIGGLIVAYLLARKSRYLIWGLAWVVFAFAMMYEGRIFLGGLAGATALAMPGLLLADAFNPTVDPNLCVHDWDEHWNVGLTEFRLRCKKCGTYNKEFGVVFVSESRRQVRRIPGKITDESPHPPSTQ